MKISGLLIFFVCIMLHTAGSAADIIKIYSPYSPAHSGTPAVLKIINQANASQKNYTFILEFKPGGQQVIAVNSIEPSSGLAIIAPAFVDHVTTGVLDKNNYVPVHALGDACWAVIVNKPLTESLEFVVGGVGHGNAAHLTALALGEKYGFKVRYIVFKSNADALVNMAGNNGVEMVVEKYEVYDALRTKNNQLKMVAASCPNRLPQEPGIKTLSELGIDAPYIFNIIVAHRDMPPNKRKDISKILDNAAKEVGADEIYRLSALRPPMFAGVDNMEFYQNSIATVKSLQNKYKTEIKLSKSLTQ
jgi:hypothetical protein